MLFHQADYDLRCEWGLHGLRSVGPGSDAIVVVDVLSFSTAVDIAVSNGASVLPYRWKDETAAQFAQAKRALLAADRCRPGAYSLSPASLQSIAAGTALVLPSPNGSTLCLGTKGVPTFTACLRNASAVARRVSKFASRIALIPAGERWSDDTLRPALEDLIGAGAVLSELNGRLSPEAELAVAAFKRFRRNLHEAVSRCGSGAELIERGFARDVEIATEYAASSSVPVLDEDRFIDDRSQS
ncbi:MAG: 2-phosphosulfolactate phosphatase [Bryobacteraceae bacterium]